MPGIKISELSPVGVQLFQDSESFLNELTEEELDSIVGGARVYMTVDSVRNFTIATEINTKVVSVFDTKRSEFNTDSVRGNDRVKTESRGVSAFTSIDVNGVYDLEIVCQQSPGLEIRADENILPLIVTQVRGNTLFIYNDKSIYTKNKLTIEITTRELEKISAIGSNQINISQIDSSKLSLKQSGSGKTVISGQTKELQLDISGAIYVDAKKMHSQIVRVAIDGASSAEIWATEELNASISGVGSINYYGNPKNLIKRVVGIGSINRK